MNTMGGHFCLPVVDASSLVAPSPLASMHGSDSIQATVYLEPNTGFVDLNSSIDGLFRLELSYGPSDGSVHFAAENIQVSYTSSTGELQLQFDTSPGMFKFFFVLCFHCVCLLISKHSSRRVVTD